MRIPWVEVSLICHIKATYLPKDNYTLSNYMYSFSYIIVSVQRSISKYSIYLTRTLELSRMYTWNLGVEIWHFCMVPLSCKIRHCYKIGIHCFLCWQDWHVTATVVHYLNNPWMHKRIRHDTNWLEDIVVFSQHNWHNLVADFQTTNLKSWKASRKPDLLYLLVKIVINPELKHVAQHW